MAVQRLFWRNDVENRDIHILPGMVSPRLDQLIFIEDTLGNSRADQPKPGVAIAFAGAPAIAGVVVNPATGEVTASPAPGVVLPQTMVVTCTATPAAAVVNTSIRITIHQAFDRIWLTPAVFNAAGAATSGLTVRRGANVRFSVLAKFTDGEIADLSNWSPLDTPAQAAAAAADRRFVHLALDNTPALVWGGGGAGMAVDVRTGILSCTNAAANIIVTASIKPFPAPQAKTASAPAVGAPPWSTPVPLTRLQGPGFAKMADVRNVLILPDGFRATQRAEFEELAREMVSRLTTRRRTRPYDLLSHKFNYFMAWVESPQPEISVMNELERLNVAGVNADGKEFEPPAMPAIADRFLVNERNTAFHTAMGARPAARPRNANRVVTFHPFRMHNADFDAFLNALTDAAGAPVGGVWAQGGKDEALVAILCRSVRLGGGNAFRGTGRYIAMTLERREHHQVARNVAGNGYDLRIASINAAAARVICWTTLAHEVGHSFGLLDEYGWTAGAPPAFQNVGIDVSPNIQRRDPLLTGANLDANKIKWRWPRIEKAGVLTANPAPVGARFRCMLEPGHAAAFRVGDIVRLRPPTLSDLFKVTAVSPPPANDVVIELVPGGAALVPATFPAGSFLLKSNAAGSYLVTTVGVLTVPPAAVGPRFRCSLQAGQADDFAVNNFVHLRTRDLLSAPTVSDRLKVTAQAGDEVEIELLPGGAAPAPANFPRRSVLIAPKRAAAVAPALGADLEMVHVDTRARINATRNPLNAVPSNPPVPNRPCVDGSATTPTPATNFERGHTPNPPIYSAWIVGLFESGAEHRCGVYHPTGVCTMRAGRYAKDTAAYQFCPVCRYAMVDLVDPSKHGAIDRDYDPRYPV